MQKIIFVFVFLFDSMVFGKGPVARSIDEVTLTIDQKKTHEIVSKEMVRVFNSYSTWKELFKAYTEDLNSREKEEWKLFFENKNINLDKKIGIKFEYRKPFIIGSAVQNEEGVKTPQLKSQFKIQLINLENNAYEINGRLIKISPRLNVSERLKLVWNVSESQIKKERSTAAAKPSSLFNLLIPEASALAFAGVPLWAWLTGSSGLVVGGGGLWWSRKMSEPARNLKQVIQEYQSRSGFEVVNVEFESNKLTSSGGSQTTFCEISRRGAFDVELNKASIILHEKRRVEDKLVVLPVTYVFSYELDEANRIKKDARGEPVIVTEVMYPEDKKILEYSLVDRTYRELKMDRYLREQIQSMRSEAVANSDKRIEGLRQATLRCCKAGNCPDSVASEFQKEEYIRPSGSSRAVN